MIRLHMLVLKSSQPDELAKQYSTLGISFVHHRHGQGPMHYSAELGPIVFEIYPLPTSVSHVEDNNLVGFELEEADQRLEEWKRQGGIVLKDLRPTEFGTVALLKDLDGRKVSILAVNSNNPNS